MKKVITICDRCGNATEEENYHWLETTQKIVNLCEKCWHDFKVFMDEKGIVNLWRIAVPRFKWEGKIGGDPNNPFPLTKTRLK